jgi:hypothetical protein
MLVTKERRAAAQNQIRCVFAILIASVSSHRVHVRHEMVHTHSLEDGLRCCDIHASS